MLYPFKNLSYLLVAALVCSAGLYACSNDSQDTGSLSLAITDAPVDGAQSVVVTFTSVLIKPASGEAEIIMLDQPLQIDLLNLSGTSSTVLLDDMVLTAGDYEWIRLAIDDDPAMTYIVDSMGQQHSLRIPSGDTTGLKLNREFNIASDGEISFTIDFDLRKSVHMTGNGQYMMRPTLRIVETEQAASLSGSVDNTLVTEGCAPGVYLFNAERVLDDLDGVDDPIFSSALPEQGPFTYSAGFLPPGDYRIGFTCDAGQDANDEDDVLSFSHETIVTLGAGEDAVFDFGPST